MPPSDSKKSDIHSVQFDKTKWTPARALAWLKDHDLKNIKPVHETANFYRYRIIDPRFFRSFITKKLDNGIELILGFYNLSNSIRLLD